RPVRAQHDHAGGGSAYDAAVRQLRRAAAESRNPRQLIGGILLAAGQSRRFAPRQKLLEPWHGEPLVRRAARHLVDAGLEPIVVVISDDERYADARSGLPLRLVTNPAPDLGVAAHPEAVVAVGLSAAMGDDVDRPEDWPA